MRKRRPWMALLAVGVGLFIAFALAEGALRLFWTPPLLRSTVEIGPHPFYSWAPLPGIVGVRVSGEFEHAITHTSQSMRGRVIFGRQKGPTVERRVLFLGDSFTYGIGAGDDESFPARLDRAWPRIEVVNAGCAAYGTRESLAVLDRLGAALRPDLTVLVLFWNDLEDNVGRSSPDFRIGASGRVERIDEVPAGGPDPLSELPPAEARTRSRYSKSYFALLFKEGFKGLRYRVLGIKKRPIHTEEQLAEAWTVTERLFAVAARRAAEIGTRLVVVSIPNHTQINPDARIRNIDPLNYEIQDRLAATCARLDLDCIDLRKGMREAWKKSGDDFYYFADRHLTPAGHEAFAELLRPQLEELLERDGG